MAAAPKLCASISAVFYERVGATRLGDMTEHSWPQVLSSASGLSSFRE